MKSHTRFHALALAGLLSAVALPAAARTAAAPPAASRGTDSATAHSLLHHPRALAKFLHLSASQTTQLLAFDKTLQQTVEPLRQARPPLCTQLIADLGANPPQPSVVGADSINLYDNKQQIVDARKAFDSSFSAILDPAQLAAYNALKALARAADPEINVIGDCPRPTS
jgi:Spy/CpxP family protein refolding chaperone